jgi:hypothetical protein
MGIVLRRGLGWGVLLVLLCLAASSRGAAAIRFVIDREECFSHNVDYEGDTVHVSFVVIKADTPWHYTQDGVDLVVWPSLPLSPIFLPL